MVQYPDYHENNGSTKSGAVREKEEYEKRREEEDREFDRKKREKFLKEREEAKATKPKGIKEKISAYREERRYKGFKKQKEGEERTFLVKKSQERKEFGRELTKEEKEEFEQYKQQKRDEQAARRAKIKQGVQKAGQYAQRVAEKSQDLSENLGIGSSGFSGGDDIGDRANGPAGMGRPAGRDPIADMFDMRGASSHGGDSGQRGFPPSKGFDDWFVKQSTPNSPAGGQSKSYEDLFYRPTPGDPVPNAGFGPSRGYDDLFVQPRAATKAMEKPIKHKGNKKRDHSKELVRDVDTSGGFGSGLDIADFFYDPYTKPKKGKKGGLFGNLI